MPVRRAPNELAPFRVQMQREQVRESEGCFAQSPHDVDSGRRCDAIAHDGFDPLLEMRCWGVIYTGALSPLALLTRHSPPRGVI